MRDADKALAAKAVYGYNVGRGNNPGRLARRGLLQVRPHEPRWGPLPWMPRPGVAVGWVRQGTDLAPWVGRVIPEYRND